MARLTAAGVLGLALALIMVCFAQAKPLGIANFKAYNVPPEKSSFSLSLVGQATCLGPGIVVLLVMFAELFLTGQLGDTYSNEEGAPPPPPPEEPQLTKTVHLICTFLFVPYIPLGILAFLFFR